MKRVFTLFLALLLCVCVCACGASDPNDGNQPDKPQNGTGPSVQTPIDGADPGEDEPAVNLDIEQGTIFNEGMAFVTLRDSEGIHAIDEKGKVLFSLQDKTLGTAFYNGLAYVHYAGDNHELCYALCDKTGNLYTADQFGGTKFYDLQTENSRTELLSDGIILVYNEENQTLGTMDTSFEWIVPMSGEFLTKFEKIRNNSQWYYNGYAMVISSMDGRAYLNLRTGETGEDLREVEVERASDLYFVEEDGSVIDARTLETVFMINEAKTIVKGGVGYFEFQDGKLLMLDLEITPGTTDYQMRYYVIDDRGNMLLQPTYKESKYAGWVIATDASVALSKDTLLLSYATTQTVVNSAGAKEAKIDTKWETSDLEGNILGSFEVFAPAEDEDKIYYISSSKAAGNDSVIIVTYIVTSYDKDLKYMEGETYTKYFDLNFKPLF